MTHIMWYPTETLTLTHSLGQGEGGRGAPSMMIILEANIFLLSTGNRFKDNYYQPHKNPGKDFFSALSLTRERVRVPDASVLTTNSNHRV